MTGTSGYRFECNLHLIKIPSHLNRESKLGGLEIIVNHNCAYVAKTLGNGSQGGGIMFSDKVPLNLSDLLARHLVLN